jgi:hypothetical protein
VSIHIMETPDSQPCENAVYPASDTVLWEMSECAMYTPKYAGLPLYSIAWCDATFSVTEKPEPDLSVRKPPERSVNVQRVIVTATEAPSTYKANPEPMCANSHPRNTKSLLSTTWIAPGAAPKEFKRQVALPGDPVQLPHGTPLQ